MQYAKSLSKADQERYTRKLEVLYDAVGGSSTCTTLTDPYEILREKWSDSISSWPPVEFGDIYAYLIETPGQFSREKLMAYKSLDAFNCYIRYV